jgi:hypothetical protein
MHKRNWSQYNKDLVQRGSLTFLIDPKKFKTLRTPKCRGIGRPQEFSNPLIELLAITKTHFKMTYRFLEGFSKSFLTKLMPEVKFPTYSLICKRLVAIGITLPSLPASKSSTIILDTTGMKIIGEGEWKVKVHGRGRPRKWVKVHISVDPSTLHIVAEVTSESNVGDSKMTEELLKQIPGKIKCVIADGGYDKKQSREAIRKRKARQLIPPPQNARYKGNNDERDMAILEILGLGNNREGRSLWGKLRGYNRRALVESVFSKLKRLFGERFYSKTFDRQRIESRLRCLLANRMCSV